MSKIIWDAVGEKIWETGVDHGVLYTPTAYGVYGGGVAWNGLVSVTEKPTGAEANNQYADNIKYLTIYSSEDFEGTIEAFTYPDEFAECDGQKFIADGVSVGQQARKPFGFAYRSVLGNDTEGQEYGYKLHLVYGCMVTPSERAYETMNDSPEAMTLSWDFTTIPVPVTGMRPTAHICINSTKVDADKLAALEAVMYGTEADDPRLPSPDEVHTLIGSALFKSARDRALERANALPQAIELANQHAAAMPTTKAPRSR